MVVCPLCEHPQELGDTCEECGRALGGLGAAPLPTPALEGLERTQLEGGADMPLGEPMPELSSHRAAGVFISEPTAVPGFEPTELLGGQGEQPTPRVAAGSPAVPQAMVSCRYCGQPQGDGPLCERCGMQLPRLFRASDPDEEGRSRCPACGAKAQLRERCPSCGASLWARGSTT